MKAVSARVLAILIFLSAGVATGDAAGATQPAVPPASRLAAAVRAAEAEFQPVTPERVDAARQTLRQAVDSLRSHLEQSGANGEAWKRFLHWGDLERQLSGAAQPDPEELRQVRQCFVGNHAGLERPVLVAVREALGQYAQLLEDARQPDLEQQFGTHLAALAGAVEAWTAAPSQETRTTVASHLGWLERRGQAPSAAEAVRRAISHPNLMLHVSEKVLVSVIGAPVDEVGPVADVILGTQVCGTGRTIGQITGSVVPNDPCAVFEIRMIATNYADTVGINGPVRVFQENRTELFGWKRVVIDREGLRPLPAESAASVSNCLKGLDTTASSRLVDRAIRRRATRKMSEQGDLADRIAEDHQRQNLKDRLDREVDARLAKENADLHDELLDPMVRCDVFARQFDTRSHGKMLTATLQFAAAGQLGAAGAAPGLSAEPDLGFQIHQSALENLLAGTWAGKTVAADELAGLMRRNRDPSAQKSSRGSDDVLITLAQEKPFDVRIQGGIVALTVHGQRYVNGSQSYPPMDVTVEYRVERHDGGLRATLVGDLKIEPPRLANGQPGRLSFREVGLRKLLRTRLERDLDREIVYERLTFEGRFRNLGEFHFMEVVADNGWALLGCRQAERASQSP